MTLPTSVLLLALAAAVAAVAAPAPRKVVIAHRGASGYLPEHTLEAVAMAHAQGADFIEQDVVLTKDDVPVVLHDIHIDTVTDVAARFPDRKRADGRYYAIDFTLAELKQLSVSERFDPRTGVAVFPKRFPVRTGTFRVPTLEEEIVLVQGLNRSTGRTAGVYPEVKDPAWHRAEGRDASRRTLEVLARHGYASKADPVYVQCFDFAEVKRIRNELGWKGRLVQLVESSGGANNSPAHDRHRTPAGLAEIAAVADGLGPALTDVVLFEKDKGFAPTGLVKAAHAAGLEVHPYTARADSLPSTVTFEKLLELALVKAGADGIFTDHPDRALQFLARSAAPTAPRR